ncbi:DMT family transporter [Abyssicoccus albus]|uniref:DMT family transporter n=1 Tax=Abyssicoccus albus TaxID=1817405 RepID=UPI00097E3791|nr:multidrug efflux SMR transporter [Abyssicoccus albus]AQL55675.1 ligand-binding protein SH3 [Abyssicoccus albus]
MRSWIYLIAGGLMEVVWAYGLAFSDGLSKIEWVIPTVIAVVISFWLFGKALSELPVSTGYALFTGLGAFGTAICGMVLFNEEVSLLKIVFLVSLISCIIGLKLVPEKKESTQYPMQIISDELEEVE